MSLLEPLRPKPSVWRRPMDDDTGYPWVVTLAAEGRAFAFQTWDLAILYLDLTGRLSPRKEAS